MSDRDYEQEEREIALSYLSGEIPYEVSFKLYRKVLADKRKENNEGEK